MDAFQAPLVHRIVYDTSATASCKVVNEHPTAGCGVYNTSEMQKALVAVEQRKVSIWSAAKRLSIAC